MKKLFLLSLCAGAALLSACTKESLPASQEAAAGMPIELGLDVYETKALLRTNMTESVMRTDAKGFRCMVLDADASAKTTLYEAKSAYQSSNKYRLKVGGVTQYWPVSGRRSFYAVSLGGSETEQLYMANASGNVTIEVKSSDQEQDWWPGEKDIICAKALNCAPKSNPSMTFSHILSWVSKVEVSLTTSAAAATSVVLESVTFTAPRYGTYSITNNSWTIPTTNKEYTFLSQNVTIAKSGTTTIQGGDANNAADFMVVPCTSATRSSVLTVTWTVTSSAGTETYTRTANLTFPAGKQNTIKMTLDDKGKDVSITATGWDFSTLINNGGSLGTGAGVR